MTKGIYLLRFRGLDAVYVGQSLNIEERYSKHLYRLRNNKANHKLQQAYQTLGEPELSILHTLEEASQDSLDELEQMGIEIFDAVDSGLNIRSKPSGGGEGLAGQYHANSKYSNDVVYKVFHMICDNSSSFKEISNTFNVNISLVRDISKGKAHRWLQKLYPEKYLEMLDLVNTREKNTYKDRHGVCPQLVSPQGELVTIHNIAEFSKKHCLNKSHISGVISGKRKSHLGWTKPN